MNKILNILIIEDNSDDIFLIKKMLERSGLKFRSKFLHQKPDFINAITEEAFDMILTDSSMFQFSSQDVLNILKEHKLNTPLIIFSGTITDAVAAKLVKEGAFDYIHKDNFKQLAASVQKAAAKINHPSAQ